MAAAQAPVTPTREELDPFARDRDNRPRSVRVSGEIERSPCALADPAYSHIRLKLTSANFNNLGPVAAEELRPAYAGVLGTDQPLSVVCDIRDAAATILRRKGYIAAVQVPVQKIEDGAVRFEVLYARMTSVRVIGEVGPNAGLIERYLQPLSGGEVFNRIAAERYLLLAEDIPGYDVRLTLKPAGTGPGEMIGEVAVAYTPLTADLGIQNLAGRETGRWGGQLGVTYNGLTGMGDQTRASIYSTAQVDEQQILQVSHDMLLGGEGLRLGGLFTYAWTRPDLGAGVDVKARTLFANLELSYPFIRSLGGTLRGSAGLDFIDQKVRFAGALFSKDKIRVGYLRLAGEAADTRGSGPGGAPFWRLNGNVEVRQGFHILGASRDCAKNLVLCADPAYIPPSRLTADPTAMLVRAAANADIRFAPKAVFSLAPRMQYTAKRLFPFEQISAGNYTVGRGFDPGAVIGDSGAGFTAEVRAEGLKIGSAMRWTLQPYAFSDNLWLWTHDDGISGSTKVHSAGGGLRVDYDNRARIDLSLAVPLNELPGETKKRDPRFLVTFALNLLPWRKR